MTLIDSHAHLDLQEFDPDRDDVIRRARDAGVEAILTIGIGMKECRHALELAHRWPFIYAALGIHPHNARQCNRRALEFLQYNASDPKVVAVGEIGLDFYHHRAPRDEQIRAFREQIYLSKSLKLPIIIHDREAHRETIEILREEQAGEFGGVLHCFSGDVAMARACIDLGFYISIPGVVTFRTARILHEVVQVVPLEHLLVETDCPFLTPVPFRGKRNEPAYVRYVAETIATLKQVPFETVARVTAENARTLFGFPRTVSDAAW